MAGPRFPHVPGFVKPGVMLAIKLEGKHLSELKEGDTIEVSCTGDAVEGV